MKTTNSGLTDTIQSKLENLKSDVELGNALEAIGLTYIGSGIARWVYGNSDYVVKINKYNTYQTQCEVNAYDSIPEKAKYLYNPPIAFDPEYKWAIYRRAKVATNENNTDDLTYDQATKIAQQIMDKLKELNLYHTVDGTNDVHEGNVGLIEGKPVIIDYGI